MTAILGDFWEANCGVCLHHQQIKLPASASQPASSDNQEQPTLDAIDPAVAGT
jgi:hypothetical protein